MANSPSSDDAKRSKTFQPNPANLNQAWETDRLGYTVSQLGGTEVKGGSKSPSGTKLLLTIKIGFITRQFAFTEVDQATRVHATIAHVMPGLSAHFQDVK